MRLAFNLIPLVLACGCTTNPIGQDAPALQPSAEAGTSIILENRTRTQQNVRVGTTEYELAPLQNVRATLRSIPPEYVGTDETVTVRLVDEGLPLPHYVIDRHKPALDP